MRVGPDDPILAVGRANAADTIKEFEVVRNLSQEEWDLAVRQNTVLSSLNGPTTLGKVDKASRELATYLDDAFSSSGVQLRAWSRDEWAASLEQWLVQYVAVRRRFKNALQSSIGAEAAALAEADFKTAYQTDCDYRLIWELRNLSEHGHVVLGFIHHAGGLGPGGKPEESWTLPLAPVLASMDKEPARKALASLWEGVEAVPLVGYFDHCMDVLNRLVCAVWLRHQGDLIDSADAVLRMAGEVAQNGDGDPVLMKLLMTKSGPTNIDMSPLFVDVAKQIRPLLADCRRVMAAS